MSSKSFLPFDKYDLYLKSVQSPEGDVVFFRKTYRDLKRKNPKVLREDFCGTGILCVEWAKLSPAHEAYGVDLDPEPLAYGQKRFLDHLKPGQRRRVQLLRRNVLEPKLPMADVSVALNFSYFLFRERAALMSYLKNVRRHLKADGIAIFDLFGGSQCQDAIEDRHAQKGFTYYWEQKGFDPITHHADFSINFRVGGKRYEDVFTYQWRMWTIPELREMLAEAGFRRTHVYWEGTNRQGGGNGVFTKAESTDESCLSWIAYVVAEK